MLIPDRLIHSSQPAIGEVMCCSFPLVARLVGSFFKCGSSAGGD